MIEKNIITNGGNVFYWVSDEWSKEKETLFFLHGLTADHTMFEKQFDYFSNSCNIIAWDAPAHGKSRPYTQFTYEKAAKVIKEILKELKVSKVILVGQSMGGFISQSFIYRYPEKVKGFIAIDSTPFGDYYSKSDIWWLRQIEWMSKLFPVNMLKKAMAKQNSVTRYGQENMIKMLSVYGKEELCKLMGIGYAGFLEDNRDLQITCSTILLVGEKDKTGKVRVYNKEWSRRTGIELIWIPNAAHNSNVDNYESVNSNIKNFIDGLSC